MSVQFNEENIGGMNYGRPEVATTPALVRIIMKLGVKTEKTANAVLIAIAIVAVLATVYITYAFVLSPSPTSSVESADQAARREAIRKRLNNQRVNQQ